MKVLAADLWPVIDAQEKFGAAADAERAAGQIHLQQLVENILLYEQVVIPTDNLLAIRILATTFGAEGLARLIDEKIVRFVRVKGMLAYVGQGIGVSSITGAAPGNSGQPLAPMWLPTGVAAHAILREVPGVEDRRALQIAQGIIAATKEVELGALRLLLRDLTYSAATSDTLDESLRPTATDLDNIPKRADQIMLPAPFRNPLAPADDIGRLLRIARTQLELVLQDSASCEDLSTQSPIGKILSVKPETKLKRLLEITEAPDIGMSVIGGRLSLDQVIELRNSRNWQDFAAWFHKECAGDPARVGREYVKLLKKAGPFDTGFLKTIRVLIPLTLDAIIPLAGTAVAAADMFLLSKIKEPSAKYFIEELEQITKVQAEAGQT